MPRRKQNVDAYGKSWSPIDLPNLEKAIKLYERLNYLQDHFADSLSGSHNIMSQINEKTDIQNELQKLGIKLTEDQAKEVADLLKHKQKENELLDKRNKLYKQESSIDNVKHRAGIGYDNSNVSWNNVGSTVAGAYQQKYAQNQLNKNYEYFKSNSTSSNNKLITKLTENKTVNDLNASASKFSKAGSLMQIAVNAFKEGVDIFVAGIKQGFNNQVSAYENTFSNIAARTYTTNSQYLSKQRNLNNELSSSGLSDNIKSSEVQQMWNKLASNGANTDAMFAQGTENVITEKILPYLDTSTVLWQQLQQSLGPTFVKQMRGINKATLEVADNTYYTEKIINDMLPLMQYLSDSQEDESAKGMAEASGFTAKAMDLGLNQSEVDNLTSSFSTLFTNPGKVITEGSAIEKYAWEQINQAGLSMNNPDDYAEILGILASTQKYFADMVPDANGNLLNSSAADVAISSIGGNYLSAKLWQNMSYEDIQKMVKAGNKAGSSTESKGTEALNNLTTGKLQTVQDKRDTWLENITNDVAYLKEKFPTWFDVIGVAVKGIVGGIAASVVGKGIGALVGSTAGGTGAGILAGGGGIALGAIGTTLAAVAIPALIASGINSYQSSKNNEQTKNINNRLSNLMEQEANNGVENEMDQYINALDKVQSRGNIGIWNADSEVGANFTKRTQLANGAWVNTETSMGDATSFTAGGENILSAFTSLDKDTRESYGLEAAWWKSGEDEAKDALNWFYSQSDSEGYNKIKTYALSNYLNHNKDKINYAQVVAALNIAAYKNGLSNEQAIAGPLSSIAGITLYSDKNDITAFLEKAGITEASKITDIYNMLGSKEVDFYLMNNKGGWMTFPEASTFKEEFNLHRLGLNRVPYDNYPALLHENETVLTASTAEELRNLVSTYRETSQQSVSFDAIIQTQTAALITELRLIKESIDSLNSSPLKTTWNSNETLNNMKHIRSTNSFNN